SKEAMISFSEKNCLKFPVISGEESKQIQEELKKLEDEKSLQILS
ncbi:2998_t:CDS:1, partial [Scutellospora calospora]